MKKRMKVIFALLTILCVIMVTGCSKTENATSEGTQTSADAGTEGAQTGSDTAQAGSETGNGQGASDNLAGDGLDSKLAAEFEKLALEGKDAMAIATALGSESFCGYDCAVSEVSEGYLPGFSADVTGFKSGVSFLPWIGSIPFAGYIFVLEDGTDLEVFVDYLKSIADPMWNICTEAKDPVIVTCNNLVFLTMVPAEEF